MFKIHKDSNRDKSKILLSIVLNLVQIFYSIGRIMFATASHLHSS
jgi:hypothetical protein